VDINPFSEVHFNVEEQLKMPPTLATTTPAQPFNLVQDSSLLQPQGFSSELSDHIDRVHNHTKVGDIYEQSTLRDIGINNMLGGAIVNKNNLEQLVREPHFNDGLVGEMSN
jgi:hypothetical protein